MRPIFVVVGPSGSGKSTLCKKLGLREVVSHTTRPMRPGERDGVDYHFVTTAQFHAMERELLERVEYSGNLYGMSLEEYWKSDIVVAEPAGAKTISTESLRLRRPAYIIGIDCQEDVRRKRMLGRGDDPKRVEERLRGDVAAFRNLNDICDIVFDGSSSDCLERVQGFIRFYGGGLG